MDPVWDLIVEPNCDGWRLDRFLARRLTRVSRARAARLRVVDLDDPTRALKKSTSVRAGQRLRAYRPVPDAEAEVPAPTVVYEDADLLVLDKPAGLATHPTASRFRATVTHWLRQRGHGEEPAHRLDVETSGVLVCSRHRRADQALKAAFVERRVQKRYWAVAEGTTRDAWTDETSLGFDASSAVRLKMGAGELPARTAFHALERGPNRTLVEARPLTGRQHQIRVHLAFAGAPIVGDKLYGPDEQLFLSALERPLTGAEYAQLGHRRLALHALSIEFEWAGRSRRFEAPFPDELGALVG